MLADSNSTWTSVSLFETLIVRHSLCCECGYTARATRLQVRGRVDSDIVVSERILEGTEPCSCRQTKKTWSTVLSAPLFLVFQPAPAECTTQLCLGTVEGAVQYELAGAIKHPPNHFTAVTTTAVFDDLQGITLGSFDKELEEPSHCAFYIRCGHDSTTAVVKPGWRSWHRVNACVKLWTKSRVHVATGRLQWLLTSGQCAVVVDQVEDSRFRLAFPPTKELAACTPSPGSVVLWEETNVSAVDSEDEDRVLVCASHSTLFYPCSTALVFGSWIVLASTDCNLGCRIAGAKYHGTICRSFKLQRVNVPKGAAR